MRKISKIIMIAVLASLTMIYSCKKEDNDPTPQDYLTAGTWKTTGIIVDPPIEILGMQISDVWDYIPDCQKDNLITFEPDGTVVEDEGASKCLPGDPQTTNDGTWSLTTDGKTLIITNPDQEQMIATIVTLNETTMVVNSDYSIEFQLLQYDVNATVTFTLQ